MKIAIVILNWNGKNLLERFLPSVVEYSEGAEIYVADNASTDDSLLWLQNHYPMVKIVRNQENYGFAKGYNEALKSISADIYCLLNSDVRVSKDWLTPISNIFENDSSVCAIQPKILAEKQPNLFEYAGAAGGFIDALGFPYCRGRIFDTIEEDQGQYNQNIPIFWASGACMFVRSADYWEVGGLDEDFFAHQEEIDLCWRWHRQGKKVLFCYKSIVYHLGGATLSVGNPKKTYLNFRNGLFMLLKNLPTKSLFPIIFMRMCLDGIAGIRFLLMGKVAHLWAILKAHFSFYRYLPKFYKKRKGNYKNPPYYEVFSIVWNYYLKGKKYHNEKS